MMRRVRRRRWPFEAGFSYKVSVGAPTTDWRPRPVHSTRLPSRGLRRAPKGAEVTMTLEVRRTFSRGAEFATAGTPGTPRGPPSLDAKGGSGNKYSWSARRRDQSSARSQSAEGRW